MGGITPALVYDKLREEKFEIAELERVRVILLQLAERAAQKGIQVFHNDFLQAAKMLRNIEDALRNEEKKLLNRAKAEL